MYTHVAPHIGGGCYTYRTLTVATLELLYDYLMALRVSDLVHHVQPRAEPAQVKVSQNGQVSIPAVVRRRWGTKEVIILDKGDRLIVRPVLPLDELVGRYEDAPGPTTDELRAMDREEEARREGLIP